MFRNIDVVLGWIAIMDYHTLGGDISFIADADTTCEWRYVGVCMRKTGKHGPAIYER